MHRVGLAELGLARFHMSSSFKDTPFDLSGRCALVTGAGRGLGKEMARLLAQAGAAIAICSRCLRPGGVVAAYDRATCKCASA